MSHTTTTRLDAADLHPTRARFGVRAWLEITVDAGEITVDGFVQLGDGPAEWVTTRYGRTAHVAVTALVHARATELVEFAAAQHEGYAVIPDATPATVEEEVEQAAPAALLFGSEYGPEARMRNSMEWGLTERAVVTRPAPREGTWIMGLECWPTAQNGLLEEADDCHGASRPADYMFDAARPHLAGWTTK